MSLDMRSHVVEGILIFQLSGRLVAGADSSTLREHINDALARKQTNLILDMKHIDFIDSTGLGNLVVAHSSTQKAGGAMKLLQLSKRNLELLVITKLSTIFEIFDDEQAAINSFFPDREVRHFDVLEFVRSQEAEKEENDKKPDESKP